MSQPPYPPGGPGYPQQPSSGGPGNFPPPNGGNYPPQQQPYPQQPGNFPPGGPGYPQQPPPGYPQQPPPNAGNFPPQQPPPPQGKNQPAPTGPLLDRAMVTTTLELSGFKIVRYLGVVRGLTVRSRSVLGNIGAGFQSLVGGKITIYVELCENAREEAFHLMMLHATQMGANAIIGMHYDANEVADGITEVLAYGTAVVVAPQPG